MHGMRMRMKLPLKHDICYAQHFAKMNSERCPASEVELFVKTVNDLKRKTYCKKVHLGYLMGL